MKQKYKPENWEVEKIVKTCFILRGIPGSGKSTLAEILSNRDISKVFSTDDSFMKNGKYSFDKSKLAEYHGKTFLRFSRAVLNREHPVIVDNTNIHKKHYEKYKQAAIDCGYRVFVITLESPPVDVAFNRCVHGVPENVIKRMAEEFKRRLK